MDKVVVIEAGSVEEAREQLRRELPDGFLLDSEAIERDGTSVTRECSQDSSQAALVEAEKLVPPGARAERPTVIREPVQRTFLVEAFDEAAARAFASDQKAPYERVDDLGLAEAGSKGLFGLGKKPNRYQVRVSSPACATVTWQQPARVRFTLRQKGLLDYVQAGDTKGVESALIAGEPVDVQNEGGYTPMMLAALQGKREVVQLLLSKRANVNATTAWGASALTRAAQDGDTELVELLLSSGANVDQMEHDGYTPLIRAAMNGHERIVEMLLQKGAHRSSATRLGLTALDLAIQNHHSGVAALLQSKAARATAERVRETPQAPRESGWKGFFLKLAAGNATTPVPPQLILCCQTTSMADRLRRGLPAEAQSILAGEAKIVEFADGQAAVCFPLQDGAQLLRFVGLLRQGDYGTERLVIKAGVAARLPVSDRQALRQALGIGQMTAFGSAGEQPGQETFVWW